MTSPERVTILSEHVATFTPDGDHRRWLFTVGDDPPYDNAITWLWQATRQSAGLPDVRLHDLRHFFASGLIAAGCNVFAGPPSEVSNLPHDGHDGRLGRTPTPQAHPR